MQSLTVIDFHGIEFPPEIETDMGITVAALEERVNSHIKFFWVVVGFGFVWLGGLSALMLQMNNSVNRVEKAQADAPARIVAKLLSEPVTSTGEVASNLNAVSTILQTSKIGQTKPDPSAITAVSTKLSDVQDRYPELPQVWQTTGVFINYKSAANIFLPKKIELIKGQPCHGEMGRAGWVFNNCDGSLEELAANVRGNIVNGHSAPFTLIHCIVRYHGGSIPAEQLTFVDCAFLFDVPIVPPHEGMMAMRQLTTAKDDSNITLSLS